MYIHPDDFKKESNLDPLNRLFLEHPQLNPPDAADSNFISFCIRKGILTNKKLAHLLKHPHIIQNKIDKVSHLDITNLSSLQSLVSTNFDKVLCYCTNREYRKFVNAARLFFLQFKGQGDGPIEQIICSMDVSHGDLTRFYDFYRDGEDFGFVEMISQMGDVFAP